MMSGIENETEWKKHTTWKLLNSKESKSDFNEKEKIPGVPILPPDILQGNSQEQRVGFAGNIPTKLQGFADKTILNPFIPLGVIATTFYLVKMCTAAYNRDQKRLQYYMRGRIAAQGFTFAAFAVGVWYIGKCAKEELDEEIKE